MLKNSDFLVYFLLFNIIFNVYKCDHRYNSYNSIPSIDYNPDFLFDDPTNLSRKLTIEDFENNILFKYYKNGRLTYIGNGWSGESLSEVGCSPLEKCAFLLHGWRETCDVEWMQVLIAKLTKYRGGCIICIDFGHYTDDSYVKLVRQFQSISNVITSKLRHLETQGFEPRNSYMFGFSFGGQLACSVGKSLGPHKFKEIDTCDMAGPGFDYKGALTDHRDAAENVQCIHTTRDKGTRYYSCHQNWRMGVCGQSQPAARDPPRGSHGLCPILYLSAFENNFYAIKKPERCTSRNPSMMWPQNYKMGYMEDRKTLVEGELFAPTGMNYPYTVPVPVLHYYIEKPTTTTGLLESFQNFNRPILERIKRARSLFKWNGFFDNYYYPYQ